MKIKIRKNGYIIFGVHVLKCAIGKNGITQFKKEGDQATPAGKFKIKKILYRPDRIDSLKTQLPIQKINPNVGWCDDPKDKAYNREISLPYKASHEVLWRKDNIYDLVLITNYNCNPVKSKKGSAIFIHIAKNNFKPTNGCIALRKEKLIMLISKIKKQSWVIIENSS